MLAGIYNITCDQGATFTRVITIFEPDGETPYDLTGYTARMQVRRQVDENDVLIELTTENGRIALGGVAGTVTLSISAEDTAGLVDDGVYDLEIISGANVHRVLKGLFRLDYEVTRDA